MLDITIEPGGMPMTLQWLFGWWNLIFVAPFAVALLYLFVYTLTGVTFGDVDADAHVEVHADGDADGGHTSGHHADSGGGDGHGGGHASFYGLALSWMGVGRVPLSLTLLVLLLAWGAAGFMTNSAIRDHAPEGWQAARVSVPVALIVSLLVTRAVVMLLGRFVPSRESFALPLRALVGTTGEALYRIDESFGMAVVRNAHGDLQHVPCRVGDGVAPIEKGARVRLVAFASDGRSFYVAAVEPAPVPAGADAKSGDGL